MLSVLISMNKLNSTKKKDSTKDASLALRHSTVHLIRLTKKIYTA